LTVEDLVRIAAECAYFDDRGTLGIRTPQGGETGTEGSNPSPSNQGEQGGHSHALAWEAAGWKTSQVNMSGERVVFVRDKGMTDSTR
jgi:hypothetical protein